MRFTNTQSSKGSNTRSERNTMNDSVSNLNFDDFERMTFSEVAEEVNQYCQSGDSAEYGRGLVSELLKCNTINEFGSSKFICGHFKLGLAVGILITSQSSADKQIELCKQTFDLMLIDKSNQIGPRSKLLLLTELCYMDQFVEGKTRQHINDTHGDTLKKHSWSPAIKDYLLAWQQGDTFRRLKAFAGLPSKEKPKPRVILVISAKGGTGKSITSVAIAKFLLSREKRVGLIDLDDSGPTMQYLFNIPEVVEGMNELPNLESIEKFAWCYPTFLDVLNVQNESSNYSNIDLLKMAEDVILSCKDEPKLSAILLPESPTYCAKIARAWAQDHSGKIIRALSACISALESKKDCEYVIIDFGPGVYGTNGAILKWASNYLNATPIVLTSSRASDIATSIYETPWLAAKYEFEWCTPLLHFINRWPYEESCVSKILKWANHSVSDAIEASLEGKKTDVSSATLIHSKRFWPIMYQNALDEYRDDDEAVFKTTQVLAQLPEDDTVRQLSTLSGDCEQNTSFKVKLDQLDNNTWYTALSLQLERHLGVRSDQ